MTIRDIISIDEEKCNGCGQCVVDCAEAALQIVNGKAKLVKEIYCDGLGACMGGCPTGALTIVKREAPAFDEAATEKHVHAVKSASSHCGCPGSRPVDFSTPSEPAAESADVRPELSNWPIQLKLAPVNAPFWAGADVLIAADCTAFSAVNFHGRFIKGKKVVIACPKLDDSQFYIGKLTEMFAQNSIKSVTVVRMEVPCCGGLSYVVKQAIAASGKDIPYGEVVIGIKGDILSEGKPQATPILQRI